MIKVLADPQRELLIERLTNGPACTCHLVDETGLKQPTVSHHLKVLREAGVVEAEPHGRYTYYRLVPASLDAAAEHVARLAERARDTANERREC
ncbi:metalloregulator ArsR/SmtB family transcription factor [Microlunatus parietis]